MEGLKKINPQSLTDYLEMMSRSVFQTGIPWKVVKANRLSIKAAFHGFDPLLVSKLSMAEIERLAADPCIIRNRRKVEDIVDNARRILELDAKYGRFRKFLGSFPSFEELTKDLRKQFKYLGEMGSYFFLWVVNEKVPSWEDWGSQ